MLTGSSPLTLGKRGRCTQGDPGGGFIPTHAGKTPQRRGGSSARWADPRSRGENIVQFAEQAVNAGSSPLTRGNRELGDIDLLPVRLIPTHAGKTRSRRPFCRMALGSSPLTRETPCGEGTPCVPEGLIPAHAGKQHVKRVRRLLLRLIPAHAGKTSGMPVSP